MDVCFLFLDYLNDEGCYCLKMDSDGAILLAPLQRTFSEIRDLQNNSQTILVESSLHTSILELEMPWLSEGKARMAIPYALEDKVSEPVELLHFAFDKQRFHNNQYLIVVLKKSRMQYIINRLKKERIDYTMLTLDWFALPQDTGCIIHSSLLLNTQEFKGALASELATLYKNKHPEEEPLSFEDSTLACYEGLPKHHEPACVWIAKQLIKSKPMNLCQGEMQQIKTNDRIKKGYRLAALLCGVWLLSIILVNAIQLYSLNKKAQHIDSQIGVIYRQFFPEAKHVISPRFRINELLDKHAENQTLFWFLLNQFATAMKSGSLTTKQLRFQNKTLFVTLISPDFSTIEQLENQLKALQVTVKQTEASTQKGHVITTLELS